jgi:DNA-binding beta-propeller fold protein YncE
MATFQRMYGCVHHVILLLVTVSLASALDIPYPRLFFIEHRNGPNLEVDDRINSAHIAPGASHFQEVYRVPSNSYISPDAIAVDKAAGYIYLAHASYGRGEIQRLNFNGTGLTTLLPKEKAGVAQFVPENLVLGTSTGRKKLYWSTKGPVLGIYRANVDGSGSELVVETAKAGCATRTDGQPCGRVTGIAIDPKDGFIYWSQMGYKGVLDGSIYRAPLERTSRGTASRRTDVQLILKDQPGPRQLQYAGGYVYIADNTQIIDEAAGSASSIRRIRVDDALKIGGVNAKAEILVSSPLPGVTNTTLSFWNSIAVDPQGGHLYFGDSIGGKLYKTALDGKVAGNGPKVETISGSATGIEYLQFVQ